MRARTTILLTIFLAAAAGFGAWWFILRPPLRETLHLQKATFADLDGWGRSDHAAAREAFRRSCAKLVRLPASAPLGYAGTAGDWQAACAKAQDAGGAQAFFERAFAPYAIGEGLVTGYYEPLLRGSPRRHGAFCVPVYGLPDDLLTVDLGAFRPEWAGTRITGRIEGHRFVPFPGRAQIDAHPPKARVLFWGDDPIAVFFLHIQGSGRVRLDDGSVLRVTYAGQNGRPYTPIGRVLIARYGLPRAGMSMQVIRAWLKEHPAEMRQVLESDDSFVFFRFAPAGDAALGPPGSQGVALTPRASIAVDNAIHPFGLPVYIAGEGLAGLFIAQDTGGAIKGPARADIFYGFGPRAEAAAGTLKAHPRFFVLLPKSVVPP